VGAVHHGLSCTTTAAGVENGWEMWWGPAQRISRVIYCRPRHGRRRRAKTEEKAWVVVAPAFPCLPQVTRGPGGFSVAPRVNSCSFFLCLVSSRGEGGRVRSVVGEACGPGTGDHSRGHRILANGHVVRSLRVLIRDGLRTVGV
jgi:hypothetical protein